MKITRRTFLEGTASSLIATGVSQTNVLGNPRESETLPKNLLPMVDTHQHLWDLSKLSLPWIQPGSQFHRNYLTADYLEVCAGLHVVQCVYMEVDTAPEDKVAEAEYVIGVCRRKDNPTVAAVIGGEMGTDSFPSYIRRYRDNPFIKGVRKIPRGPAGSTFLFREKKFIEHVRLLGELGMSFDLCGPPTQLVDAIRLVDACPGMRFILDHCGNADPKAFWNATRRADLASAGPPGHEPEPWRRDMAEIAKREQVVCKISGAVARLPKGEWSADDLAPVVNHCLDVFGPDRVMFASDWPVCTRAATYRQWVHALKEIVQSRSEPDRRKLFADNAIRVYGLSPPD